MTGQPSLAASVVRHTHEIMMEVKLHGFSARGALPLPALLRGVETSKKLALRGAG